MKRLSQSGSSNFCPELRKNALLISQLHFSNFALHVISGVTTKEVAGKYTNKVIIQGLEVKKEITRHPLYAHGLQFSSLRFWNDNLY